MSRFSLPSDSRDILETLPKCTAILLCDGYRDEGTHINIFGVKPGLVAIGVPWTFEK